MSLQSLLSRGDVDVMDSQSCTDHSILSIFEDPTVTTEVSVQPFQSERLHIIRDQTCKTHVSVLIELNKSVHLDCAGSSQDKSGVEEESESLLSALTEMLDSVGDDEGTLSPFDVLPDTKLLSHQRCRDNPVVGTHTGATNKRHIC